MVFFKNQNGTLVSATAKEQRVVLHLVFKVKGHFFFFFFFFLVVLRLVVGGQGAIDI